MGLQGTLRDLLEPLVIVGAAIVGGLVDIVKRFTGGFRAPPDGPHEVIEIEPTEAN